MYPDDEDEDLRSRTDARFERKASEEALMDLATELVGLSDRLLGKLDLSEVLLEVVVRARRVKEASPRYRALRLVRATLRDDDHEGIREKLLDLKDPSRGATPYDDVVRWRDRLASGDDADVDALLAAHPALDRRQIRQLVRNVKKADEGGRPDALKALTRVLRGQVG